MTTSQTNDDQDVIECISVNGVIIDLSTVSHNLRTRFHTAARASGKGDKAREQMKQIGEAILAEQAPTLATKAFADARKRSRVSGPAAIAKLMGIPQSK
jgi:hypothetical protein